jgi:hypothetical protein
MYGDTQNIEKLIKCTCLDNHDMEIEDLVDADLRSPECPVHGVGAKIVGE